MGLAGVIIDHPLIGPAITALSALSPAQWCQGFFLFAAAGVLAVAAAPDEARTLLVDYGARISSDDDGDKKDSNKNNHAQNKLVSLLAKFTSWSQVPHSWFIAFYLASAACSALWLVQYLTDGMALRQIASRQVQAAGGEMTASATLAQVAAAWAMVLLQASRRLYEHATIIKPSRSTMWVVHWVLGLGFYLFISVAVWVEGSVVVLGMPTSDFDTIVGFLKIFAATPAFMFAWINQYRCHQHLAGLKKYSLPRAGLFRRLVCPHYTCECLLYLSLAVAAAPPGRLCNRTLLCALVFVLANLGVTAAGTRKWYVDKFGSGAVADKWNMIPFLF